VPKTKAKSIKLQTARASQPWHAISVLSKGETCEAVRALRSMRFLASEAPRFPLPECTRARSCTCAYRHHADRRGTPRRSDEAAGLKRNKPVTQERRLDRDRRKAD
jgi:hypothetical protein